MSKTPYPDQHVMAKNRLVAFNNFKGRCVDCGGKAVVAHHIDFTKDNHDVANLAPLCKCCHGKRHSINNGTNAKQWNVSRISVTVEMSGLPLYVISREARINKVALSRLLNDGIASPQTMYKFAKYFKKESSDYIDPALMTVLKDIWDEL